MKIMKKLSAFMLSLIMIVGMVPVMAVKADSSATASAITLGNKKWVDSSTKAEYTFPNAKANFNNGGQKIFCLSVSDDGYFVAQTDIKLDEGSTTVDISGVELGTGYSAKVEKGKKYSSITVIDSATEGSLTNEKITYFLQNLVFSRNGVAADKEQRVSVVANQVALGDNMTAVAIDGKLHYYKYVSWGSRETEPDSTWYKAYKEAKKSIFDGMQGYLATITSDVEQQYVFKKIMNGTDGWIGGARTLDLDVDGNTIVYDSDNIDKLNPGNRTGTLQGKEWKWVSGPEAGNVFYVINTLNAWDKSGTAKGYTAWDSSEPNNKSDNVGTMIRDEFDQEYCLQYGYGTEGKWNDWYPACNESSTVGTIGYGVKGYLIEYSPYQQSAAAGGKNITPSSETKSDTKIVTGLDSESSFVVNVTDPSTGVTGPAKDSLSAENNEIYNITLPSDVDSITLTPAKTGMTVDIIEITQDGITKTVTPGTDANKEIVKIDNVKVGDNTAQVIYKVTDTSTGDAYTYTYNISRNPGAEADTEVKDPDPSTPDIPKIEPGNRETSGTDVIQKITITVPADQSELTVYPKPLDGAKLDTTYGVKKTSTAGNVKENKLGESTPEFTVDGLISTDNTVVCVKVVSKDGKSSTIYEYTVVREEDTTGKFDVTPTNPDNTTNPSEGVTGPTKDTTASKGNDYVYKITLDSDVSKVTLTPDMANVTIKDITKNGTSIGSIPADGVYTVEDIRPGTDNTVKIKYTVEDKNGVKSTYTYIIDRKNGADAKTEVKDPISPSVPKIEDKGTDGTNTVEKITITVPAGQDELTIYPNPVNGATMDTTHGTNGVEKVSGPGSVTSDLTDSTKPALTVGGLTPGQDTVVSVKVVSADGKSSKIYEYTVVREPETTITPVDPAGKDTDKVTEEDDSANTNTTSDIYKVITIPSTMDKLKLIPSLPAGAAVTKLVADGSDKTGELAADKSYTVKDIVSGKNREMIYTVTTATGDTINYHYTIKKLAANNDTSIDTNVPDKTPTDPSDDATIDNSTPSKTEVINGKTETVKDIIVKVPYKNTSVTLEPKVKEATSNIDTTYGDNGIKEDQLQGTANVTEDSAIDLTNKKSGTITVDDLECGKENIVSIRVVAEDGSSCIYRYKVTRENGKEDTITPSLPEGSTSTGTITGPTEDTSKTTENDKYYDVVLPNGTDKVTMTPEINEGDKITSITVDGEAVTIPAKGVYTVTGVTTDKAKDLIYTIETPDGKKTNYHYSIKQEKKPEEPKKDTPVDKKDPTITDITVKTEDNTTTPADVKIDNNNANKTVDITVPSNQTDYTFTPATKDPSSKITEVAKVSGPAEVSTSSDGKSFTAKGLDPKTPTIVKVTVTSSTGDTATYTVTIHRAEEGVTPDISVEMDGGSMDLNSLIPEDVRKNAKEILYHCCAHTVLAIDKDGTVRSIGRSNKYKSSLVHVIVKGQDNKWTDYTIYVKVNGATKKEEYGTLVDYKGLNYEITGEDTCRVSSWKTNYNTKKKNIVIPDTIKANGKTYKVTAIAPGAFMRNSKIVTIKIGKNVQEIGNTSFVGLRKIKKFTISKKNKYLKVAGKSGNKAKMILSKNGKILYSMTNMQGSVTIPKSVKQITEYAGAGNVKMTKLVIPASVKRIDPCAFAHAKKMTYVQFKGKVPEMANNCVVDQMNYKKGKVYVPKKYYKQYKSAFQTASKKRYGIKQFPAMSRLKKK